MGSRKKSQEDKIPCRKKSHEEKIPEEKIPWGQNPRGQNPRGQNPIRKKSHVGKYPNRTKSHKEKIPQGNIALFWFLWNIFLDRNFQMWKIYEFSLLHIHSLHIIFVSLSLSDEELALACVHYNYETPRTIVPNLYNWITESFYCHCNTVQKGTLLNCDEFIVAKAFIIIDFSYIFKYTS